MGCKYFLFWVLPLVTSPALALECLDNFVPAGDYCITAYNDFSRQGSFAVAREFCENFKPFGYQGSLWKLYEVSPLISEIVARLFENSTSGTQETFFPIWNGAGSEPEECEVVQSYGGQLQIEHSDCKEDHPFICAVKPLDTACTDELGSSFCGNYSNFFCDNTPALASYCLKTCGRCEELGSCKNLNNSWSNSWCIRKSHQGLCTSEKNNIEDYCPLSCCYHTHSSMAEIGDKKLVKATETQCKDAKDLEDCPHLLDVEKCFREPVFTSKCLQSCCKYHEAIIESALELNPSKRKQRGKNFLEKIEQHHCRNRFDDVFPATFCPTITAEMCDRESSEYDYESANRCNKTCCHFANGLPRPPPTEPTCEDETNSFPEPVCDAVDHIEDCDEDIVQLGCALKCCELGVETDKDDCTAESDELGEVVCSIVSQLSECENSEVISLGCEKTCCELGGGDGGNDNDNDDEDDDDGDGELPDDLISTVAPTGSCEGKKNRINKCDEIKLPSMCTIRSFRNKCDKRCCEVENEHPELITTRDPEECENFNDKDSRCVLLNLDNADLCYHEPYLSNCRGICCRLGFDITTTPSPSTSSLVTVSGDICNGETDGPTICQVIPFLADPIFQCDNSREFEDCDLTCCIERYLASRPTSPATTTAEPQACNHKVDRSEVACALLENLDVLCEIPSIKFECKRTCCLNDGGFLASTTSGTTASPPPSSTTVSTTTTPFINTFFESCRVRDRESRELCAQVLWSHISTDIPVEDRDLCEDVDYKDVCAFSCCAFYFATDYDSLTGLPEPFEPAECVNLVDSGDVEYGECFENYLEDQCSHDCEGTCCLLGAANLAQNPGCYNLDDRARDRDTDLYCILNCATRGQCNKHDQCPTMCAFHCCVAQNAHLRSGTATTTSSSTTTTSTMEILAPECQGQTSDLGVSCVDFLEGLPTLCEPSTTLYDVNGCSLHCCAYGAQLLETTTPETTTPAATTTVEPSTSTVVSSTSKVSTTPEPTSTGVTSTAGGGGSSSSSQVTTSEETTSEETTSEETSTEASGSSLATGSTEDSTLGIP